MTKDEKLLAEARKNFSAFLEREEKNWARAREAIQFCALEQWPAAIKRDREDPSQRGGPRPCPVIDKTNQYVRLVVNEERQNMPSIRVRPVDDEADADVAEIYDGVCRHIQDVSDAPSVYATAGEHAINGGFGYWRLFTDYCDSTSFDQEILIKPIHNRFSVLLGPHNETDGSDAKIAFIFEDIEKEDFKAKYPGKAPKSFDDAAKDYPDWYHGDFVRVAEYIRIVESGTVIVLLDTGEIIPKDEYDTFLRDAEAAGQPAPTIVKQRKAIKRSVVWNKVSGEAVLESGEIVGTHMPIIKVTGNDLVLPDGQHRLSGMVEAAMDAQRLHNYATAKFIESVALAPISPFIAAKGQIEQNPEWETANRLPHPVLTYDPIDVNGIQVPAPQRQAPAGVPAGWQQLLLDTEHGIEGATGMYGASIGGPSRERSGIALQTQKTQGNTGNYHYPDNLSRSIRATGRVLVEWIPLVYDTAREQRILSEDGEPQSVHLDPEQEQAVREEPDTINIGQIKKIYNLGIGKYDVAVEAGPSFLSKRQEASQFAMELVRSDPTLMQKAGDKIFRLFDVYGMREIADRLKLFLPPQVQEAEQEGKKQDPQVMAAMQQVQAAMQEVQTKAQALQQAEQELHAEASKVGADKADLSAAQAKLAAEGRVLRAEYDKLVAQLKLQVIEAADQMAPEPMEPETAPEVPQDDPATVALAEVMREHGAQTQQILQVLGEMFSKSHQDSAATMAQALDRVTQAVTRPRKTTVQRDENGDILGGTVE